MKTCTSCAVDKPLDLFYAKVSGKHGRTAKCIDCTKMQTAAYKRAYPDEVRLSNRRYNYAKHNLTVEQWDAMLLQQDDKRLACGEANRAERNLHIDHDHACCPGTYSCGRCIRGLLCSQCNTALGLLGDDVTKVMNLAAYLVSHQNVLAVAG